MNKLSISVFGNKIFFEIIEELKLFSEYKISSYVDFDSCLSNVIKQDEFLVFFVTKKNKIYYEKIKKINLPLIIVDESVSGEKIFNEDFIGRLNVPFTILDFRKLFISVLARYEFKKSSLITLDTYIIDKNERTIKKNNMSLQLTEKEISFLILFTQTKEPITRDFVLKSVWKYSAESETHTVETHIHRLRKKILKKFNDANFIKHSKKGYYI